MTVTEKQSMGEVLPKQTQDLKTCTVCKESKPRKQFKRTLTLAQSRAMLQRPQLSKPHTLISALCKDCQNQLKRNKAKKPYIASEIRKKIEQGVIHPTIGEQRIKRKMEEANGKKALGQKLRWQKAKMVQVDAHLEAIRTEVAGYRGRYYAYKSHLNANYEQIIPTQHALLEQHRQNYEDAKDAYKENIKPRYPRPTDPPHVFVDFLTLRLEKYFTPQTDAKVELKHTSGIYLPDYDMSNALVTTRNDKWWLVLEDRGVELLVVEPSKPEARPRTLQKQSITGVHHQTTTNEGETP